MLVVELLFLGRRAANEAAIAEADIVNEPLRTEKYDSTILIDD
jgi:hypothetical protein